MEMIERVARAICDYDSPRYDDSGPDEDFRNLFRGMALSALGAIREPTPEMIALGNEALAEAKPADYIWRVMFAELVKL